MLQTSARLLRLLSLLQLHRDWTGGALAERLGVTSRTVRSDIEKLRSLGYPVHAAPGVSGGYRLGAGAELPPLLLDDEEAVAVAVGLRTSSGVTGIEESAVRALTKLEQVLPSRLRHRITALHTAMAAAGTAGPTVAANSLIAIATAIRGHERLCYDYESFDGGVSRRIVEPHRLVHIRGRWYLLAWDVDRDDWRTFRADRLRLRPPHGPRFTPRPDPGGDVVAHVEKGLGTAAWRYRTRAIVHAPAATVVARVPPSVTVEAIDERSCSVHVGSDDPATLALWLGMIDADFEIDDCPELAERLRILARRYARAAG
jgi:predicted DNA-binding transcriptional regulator YafY